MNTKSSGGDDEKLRKVLSEWSVATPLPPRFQDQVWQRIARAESKAESPLLSGLARLFEVVLPRPRIALTYIAVLCVLGVAAGSVTAQIQSNHLNATLGARYVQSVYPYRAEITQP